MEFFSLVIPLLPLLLKTNMVKFRAKEYICGLKLGNYFKQRLVCIAVVLVKNFAVERSGLTAFTQLKLLIEYLIAPHNVKIRLCIMTVS